MTCLRSIFQQSCKSTFEERKKTFMWKQNRRSVSLVRWIARVSPLLNGVVSTQCMSLLPLLQKTAGRLTACFIKKMCGGRNSQTESDRLEFDLKCKDERKCVRSCNRQHQTRCLRCIIACFRCKAAGNWSVSKSVNPKSLLRRGSSTRVCPDPQT